MASAELEQIVRALITDKANRLAFYRTPFDFVARFTTATKLSRDEWCVLLSVNQFRIADAFASNAALKKQIELFNLEEAWEAVSSASCADAPTLTIMAAGSAWGATWPTRLENVCPREQKPSQAIWAVGEGLLPPLKASGLPAEDGADIATPGATIFLKSRTTGAAVGPIPSKKGVARQFRRIWIAADLPALADGVYEVRVRNDAHEDIGPVALSVKS